MKLIYFWSFQCLSYFICFTTKIKHIIEFFQSLVSDIDSKIKEKQAKLDSHIIENERPKELTEKIEKYEAEITKLSLKVEELREEAKIDDKQNLDAEIQALKKKKEEILNMENNGEGKKQFQVFGFCILIMEYVYIYRFAKYVGLF